MESDEFGIDEEYRPVALASLADEIDRAACRREDLAGRDLMFKLADAARRLSKVCPIAPPVT